MEKSAIEIGGKLLGVGWSLWIPLRVSCSGEFLVPAFSP
jgi:hypothetical protein